MNTSDVITDADGETILDEQHLAQFIDEAIDDFILIMNEALADVPQSLETLTQASTLGDCTQVKALAHSLRGTVASFGCRLMSEKLLVLEHAVPVSGVPTAETLEELQAVWKRTLPAIEAWIKQNATV